MGHGKAHLRHYYCQRTGSNCWLSYFVSQSEDPLECLKSSPQTLQAYAGIVTQITPEPLASTVFPIHYLLFLLPQDAYVIRPVDIIFLYKHNLILFFFRLVNVIQMDTSQWNWAAYRMKMKWIHLDIIDCIYLQQKFKMVYLVIPTLISSKIYYTYRYSMIF